LKPFAGEADDDYKDGLLSLTSGQKRNKPMVASVGEENYTQKIMGEKITHPT